MTGPLTIHKTIRTCLRLALQIQRTIFIRGPIQVTTWTSSPLDSSIQQWSEVAIRLGKVRPSPLPSLLAQRDGFFPSTPVLHLHRYRTPQGNLRRFWGLRLGPELRI